jgi:hypothetical protein
MLKERLNSYELQAMQTFDVTVKLKQRMDELDDLQKLSDYGLILAEKMATKFNITERPTETELEDYRK